MKLPKTSNSYCQKCRKHTEHKLVQVKNKGRSKAHTQSKGSTIRMNLRGLRRGSGNFGKYSRPTKPKMSGRKQGKNPDLRMKCNVCGKSQVFTLHQRFKKLEFKQ